MNLGVLELRRGDYRRGARRVPRSAASLHDAAEQHEPRGRAVQPRHARDRAWRPGSGRARSIARRRRWPSSSVPTSIAVGAHAGAGLTALRQQDVAAARAELAAAQRMLGGRDGLVVPGTRAARGARRSGSRCSTERSTIAHARFARRSRSSSRCDVYGAAWLLADCGAELATEDPTIWDDRGALRRQLDGAAVRAARRAVHRAARLREPAAATRQRATRDRERAGGRLIMAAWRRQRRASQSISGAS